MRFRAVIDHGQQWEKVGPIVGRMPSDCRDRYRNHIVNKSVRVTGAFEVFKTIGPFCINIP